MANSHPLISVLLTLVTLSCANYGNLRLTHEGEFLSLPDGPKTVIFQKKTTSIGPLRTRVNWESIRDRPRRFKHLNGPFFKELHDDGQYGPTLIICLTYLHTDYSIHGAYDLDLDAEACAESQGISLKKFAENMFYLQHQYASLNCVIFTLDNLFQEQWATPDYLQELSEKRWSGTDELIYPHLKHELDSVGRIDAWPQVAWDAALKSKGFISNSGAIATDFERSGAFYGEPLDIFGMGIDYTHFPQYELTKELGGHIEAIRRIGRIWWKFNSAAPSTFGTLYKTGSIKPCGGTGHWNECREFIHGVLAKYPGNSARVVRCPTTAQLSEPLWHLRRSADLRKKSDILPNPVLWEKYCRNPNLIQEVCFGELYNFQDQPRYHDIVAECPSRRCTEALCQKIPTDSTPPILSLFHHCNLFNHQCEEYNDIEHADTVGGACDVSVNRCPDYLPDCIGEATWEGDLGKCSCGITHIGSCKDPSPICLLTTHQCAICTDGKDGRTNDRRDSCTDGNVCIRKMRGRECVHGLDYLKRLPEPLPVPVRLVHAMKGEPAEKHSSSSQASATPTFELFVDGVFLSVFFGFGVFFIGAVLGCFMCKNLSQRK